MSISIILTDGKAQLERGADASETDVDHSVLFVFWAYLALFALFALYLRFVGGTAAVIWKEYR